MESVRVGIVLREEDLGAWAGRLHQLAERSVAAGIDHLTVGDHVSSPFGPPDVVAAALAPFLEAGCRHFNFVPEADSREAAIEAVAEVKALLSNARQP